MDADYKYLSALTPIFPVQTVILITPDVWSLDAVKSHHGTAVLLPQLPYQHLGCPYIL